MVKLCPVAFQKGAKRSSSGAMMKELLRQQVLSQLLVSKVILLHAGLGSRLRSLHLRPQRVHVGRVCTGGTEAFN